MQVAPVSSRSSRFAASSGISSAEKEIERLEAEQSEIEDALSNPDIAADYVKTAELCEKLEKIKDDLLSQMENWEKLSEELENFTLTD